MKKEKAITLISLVITIIILIILAGIAVNLSLGENGIFRRARDARDKYLAEAEKEEQELNELYKQLGMVDLPENTKENPQEIGTEVALKEGWGTQTVSYTSTKNGETVKKLTKVATVYAVSVGNGETVPIPKNFYYVGGTLDTGVIISDNIEDKYDGKTNKTTYEYTRKLKGNQFVWIPCSTSEYTKCNVWNGTTQTNSKLGTTWWDTTTPKAELSQIEKYGGFYVARYEAGLASDIPEFKTEQTHTKSNQIYNKEGKPQSKAGIAPWNFVDWNMSKKNAESMYNNEYVSSGLITGTQWDVMLNKMFSKGAITASDLTNSSEWGNFRNTKLTYTGRLAKAVYIKKWYLPAFSIEETTEGETTIYNSNNTYGDLLTTGASSTTERYHLFDVAGNLWEWTEETSLYGGNTDTQYRMFRGGGFVEADSACFRLYDNACTTFLDIGFRIVLYIK